MMNSVDRGAVDPHGEMRKRSEQNNPPLGHDSRALNLTSWPPQRADEFANSMGSVHDRHALGEVPLS
jgi:hypothetical protein